MINAVHGQRFGQQVAVGEEPAVARGCQGDGIHGVEQIVEGIVAGHDEHAAFFATFAQTVCGALLLVGTGRIFSRWL
ncbi:MAG: hypothetical protein Q8Q59_07525 [Luteolibacter sp.]|jgi:hypothetical protein|nr:hypothetical protein [Luteolibacter sp.]